MRRGPWLALADPVFRSRSLARLLFGADPCPEGGRPPHDAFDLATLALRRGLGRWLAPGQPLVDVGTGPGAPLAAWAARRGHRVVAWEAHPASAHRAREVLAAAFGPAGPTVIAAPFGPDSPLPAGALVVANPPYVPTALGRRLGLDPARPHAWDGGADGLDSYRALAAALAGRGPLDLVVGGNRHVHRPAAVAAALGRPVRDRVGLGPGYGLRLG